jgi:hypothetical protein
VRHTAPAERQEVQSPVATATVSRAPRAYPQNQVEFTVSTFSATLETATSPHNGGVLGECCEDFMPTDETSPTTAGSVALLVNKPYR